MSDDLISRKAAINAMCDACDAVTAACPHFPCKRYLAIESLQSAERKEGRWLPVREYGGGYWVCSSCKNPTEAFAADVLYKYCPNCGADMRGEQNDND